MRDWPEAYILRHGQTVWNVAQRLQGGRDSPLTDLGRDQALRQRAILQSVDLTGFRAHSSPQGRAFVTAALALDGLIGRIRTDDRLREIGVGDFEARLRQDLPGGQAADASEESALHLYDMAPGGEGFAALRARCESFLQDRSAPVVVVTHGMTSRMLRLVLTGQDESALDSIGGGQGVVYHVRRGRQHVLTA
ncbi:histidine phosphatase family protein [Roseovarius sp. SYSU LYC5161]|uniref:histidine phosphatase family protein n=1 Tax=Roseovarius halophilus (ex Wu et al. 2025) TaxID=3376060 RepID=UPI00399BF9F0